MGRRKGSKNKPKLSEATKAKAAKSPNENELKVASVVFSNYLDFMNWVDSNGNTPPELETAIATAQDENIEPREAIKPLCDLLVSHLEEVIGKDTVKEAYFIRHLQDIELNSRNGGIAERTKLPHLHMIISVGEAGKKNNNATRHLISDWANGLYCRKNLVNKMKAGRYSKDNALAYLIHAKDQDKMQYEPQDVYTARGTNYLEIWAKNKERWHKAKATKKKLMVVSKEATDDLVDKILYEGLTRRELVLNEEYCLIKAYNSGLIDNAFKIAAQRKSARSYVALQNNEFRTSVFFFTGHLGSNKTHCAKMLIKKIIAWAKLALGENWDYLQTAEKNPLDDYCGEEIILMDDVKVDALSLGAWLQLLDPNNASNASARYSNKPDVAPRVIIITSTQDPLRYFFYLKNRTDENLGQLYRRITKAASFTNINPVHNHDTLPAEEDIVCGVFIKDQYSDAKLVPVETIEETAKRIKKFEDDTNPFLPAKVQRRCVSTNVGFKREENYPETLHPLGLCEVLIKEVAERHGRQYEYSPEGSMSIKQSVWEYVARKQIELDNELDPSCRNPFLDSAQSN